MKEIRIYPKRWRAIVLAALVLSLIAVPLLFDEGGIVMVLFSSLPGLVLVLMFGRIVFAKGRAFIVFTVACFLMLIVLFFWDMILFAWIVWSLPFIGFLPIVAIMIGIKPILVLNENGLTYRRSIFVGLYTEWSNIREAELHYYDKHVELNIHLHDEQKGINRYKGIRQRIILSYEDDYGDVYLFTRIDMKGLNVDEQYLLGIIKEYINTNDHHQRHTNIG